MFMPRVSFGTGFIAVGSSTEPQSTQIVSEKNWIDKAFKGVKAKGTEGVCTGKKFGSKSCKPGTKRYNMAKNLRKISKKK